MLSGPIAIYSDHNLISPRTLESFRSSSPCKYIPVRINYILPAIALLEEMYGEQRDEKITGLSNKLSCFH